MTKKVETEPVPLDAPPPKFNPPPAEAQPVAWSTDKPKDPGVYGVRGFNLCREPENQFEAIVAVRQYKGGLICNLHESSSEEDFDRWYRVEDCSDEFEWCRFVPAEAQSAEAVAWVSRNNALFTDAGNWRCTNPLLYSSQESPSMIPLYAAPPSAPVGVPADILRIVDTAIDVCNDRDRPAMAEDLEAVRLYVEQASAALARQPVATLPDVDDDDLTVAYMAGRHDGRKEAQQPAAVDGDWRKKAAEWLESKAVEQEAANQKWPSHAACYKEWRDRPGILRHLAIQVLAAQPGGSDNG